MNLLLNANSKVLLVALLSCIAANGTYAAELNTAYNSQYVTEGREQLNSGGIYWLSGSAAVSNNIYLAFAYGFAKNKSEDYDELNMVIAYTSTYKDFEYEVSYTHLAFLKSNETDNEAAFTFEYSGFVKTKPFVNFVYGYEASGYFIESGFTIDYSINNRTTLSPKLALAYDFGYANQDRKGFSHMSIGAVLEYSSYSNLVFSLVIEQTIGGSIIEQESSNANHLLGGINVNYSW